MAHAELHRAARTFRRLDGHTDTPAAGACRQVAATAGTRLCGGALPSSPMSRVRADHTRHVPALGAVDTDEGSAPRDGHGGAANAGDVMKRFTPRAPGGIRLGIYDSHALFRHGLRWHCAHVGHIQVVEDAEPPQPLDAWLAAIRVDVVLLDVAHTLPDVAGRSPAPAARCRWIALSDTDHRTTLLRAAHAGAMAILTRDTAPDTITQTIERVACGERLIAESLAQCTDTVEEVFHRSRIGSTVADPTDLTTRELEVLDCLARGQTTAQIATELMITTQTVKNHVSSIMNKLSASDRAMALLEAVRRGWISLDSTARPVVHLAERRTSYAAGLARRRRIALMRRRS